ncbi:sorting nexin-13-like [Carlito syrichta]|uniref:Sorting nexin-13-like n=1 Tax=Carlito syrichta TaxID=1868482 RepID=A0A3Q0DZW8_CARSF|nr:sorting nexin-13-like [Carlito syrichta]
MFTEASLSIWGWGSLGIVLFLITFGPFVIFYLAFYILCFVGGGLVVTLLFGKTNSERYLEQCEHSFLPPTSTGVPKCLEEMKREARTIKIDRRLTGANIIDEPLQQVIQFSLRDYVQYWYYTLSDDESFLLEIRQTLQNALIQFATRSKEIDWQPYFTTRIVDDFGTHLRVFRKAQQKITEKDDQVKGTAEDLVDTFFEVEVEMEKEVCRDLVCTSPKDEEGFLRDLCEVLLYLLLPPGDFQNKIMRYFVREILARGVLLPLINQLSDPDYINQYVIWMIRDSNCNYEAFMNIIKLSDNIGELEAVRDKAAEELQYLRSLDTAGDDINTIKNQINSLLFVKKVCDSRIQRLQSGKEINTVKLAANFGKLCTVPLDSILVDNVALQFFMADSDGCIFPTPLMLCACHHHHILFEDHMTGTMLKLQHSLAEKNLSQKSPASSFLSDDPHRQFLKGLMSDLCEGKPKRRFCEGKYSQQSSETYLYRQLVFASLDSEKLKRSSGIVACISSPRSQGNETGETGSKRS